MSRQNSVGYIILRTLTMTNAKRNMLSEVNQSSISLLLLSDVVDHSCLLKMLDCYRLEDIHCGMGSK